jgi:hypothetical protein
MVVTHVHLDPSEALLLSDFGLRQNITGSVTTNPTVDITLLSALSTEKLPDWYTEDLAFDIPDCQHDVSQGRWDAHQRAMSIPDMADIRTSPPR